MSGISAVAKDGLARLSVLVRMSVLITACGTPIVDEGLVAMLGCKIIRIEDPIPVLEQKSLQSDVWFKQIFIYCGRAVTFAVYMALVTFHSEYGKDRKAIVERTGRRSWETLRDCIDREVSFPSNYIFEGRESPKRLAS